MDTVAGFLNQQNSFKVKAVSQVQLALGLIATAWEPNLSGAVAVLGILATVLGNNELLQLVWLVLPACMVCFAAYLGLNICCTAVFVFQPSFCHH